MPITDGMQGSKEGEWSVEGVMMMGDTITLHHVHSHHTQPLLLSYSTHCPEHEYILHYSALINGWREKGESK